jgi:hypothetical protein
MHRASLLRLVPALLAGALAPACGDDVPTDPDVGSCEAKLLAGQLVITEIMPDPAGADADGVEWFELHNPTDADVRLIGVGLEYSKVDGTEAKGHRLKDDLVLPAGGYMTFGRVAADLKPDHIDYGYGADLTMGNTDGKLRVVCGELVVDEALYEEPENGVARQLDGRVEPTAEANDDLTKWCLASEPLGAEEFATPRAANSPCPLPETACGSCFENDLLREARVPQPGQLVINELMPNARSGEALGEWFELQVVDGPVDLNCLQYGGNTTKFAADPGSAEQLQAPACIVAEPGTYLVFAQQEEDEGVDFPLGFTMVDSPSDSNPDPGVFIAYDGVILDEVHYTSAKDGIAASLDPDAADPLANDAPEAFCAAVDPFGDGSFGTPGEDNPQCPEAVPPGHCLDGETVREIAYIQPGELVVTEVFPDPGPLGDSDLGEWVELQLGAARDLNGLQLGKLLDDPYILVEDALCRPVPADTRILVAASDDPAVNGMLPAPDVVDKALSLTNSGGALVIGVFDARSEARSELDAVTWKSTADGKSHQVALELLPQALPFDPAFNDDAAAWCDAKVTFGAGDFGTPRAENTSCADPPPPDPMCLDGDTARKVVSPQPGDLLITELHPDPQALLQSGGSGEPAGEWFEVFAAADVDLNGLDLGNTFPTAKHTIPAGEMVPCVRVSAGESALLARRGSPTDPPQNAADPLDNGGLPTPRAEYEGLSLSNSGSTLYIGVGDALIDEVTFAKPAAGKASQLDADAGCLAASPLDPACNDDQGLWCPATGNYGLGDFGSPAAANVACGVVDPPGCDNPVVPQPGDLVITEFLANPSGTETDKEWFEVFVVNTVDLNGLKLLGSGAPTQAEIDAAVPAVTGDACLTATAGSFLLFARKADPVVNGGLPPVDHLFKFALSNSNDGLALAHGSALLDGVGWVGAQAEDIAAQLDPAVLDPLMNDNPDAPPWCDAAGTGTPKQENPPCP